MTSPIRTSSDSRNAPPDPKIILVLAIEELDKLISDLVSKGHMSISPCFLDWVADSLTHTIEAKVLAALQTRRFEDPLQPGNPRAVLAPWVRHWACLEIKQQFGQYAKFCPCAEPADTLSSQRPTRSTTSGTG